MSYPTKRGAGVRRKKPARVDAQLAIAESRARPEAPELYVRDASLPFSRRYCKAHLRNKGGYLYLAWRAGKKIRDFYLGKAPRNSPTARAPVAGARAGQGQAGPELLGRVKSRSGCRPSEEWGGIL